MLIPEGEEMRGDPEPPHLARQMALQPRSLAHHRLYRTKPEQLFIARKPRPVSEFPVETEGDEMTAAPRRPRRRDGVASLVLRGRREDHRGHARPDAVQRCIEQPMILPDLSP